MKQVIKLNAVSKEYYRGGVPFMAVDNVTLDITSGDYVNIIGRSGSGKSTLLNIAAGMLSPSSGSVEVCGSLLSQSDDDTISRIRNDKIGFIPQGDSALPNLTVLENVMLPFCMYPHGGDGEGYARILLEKFGIEKLAHVLPHELSGGELRRALIARALINRPEIIIADEPTSNLDAHSAENVMQIFSALNSEGLTLLIVSHDLDTLKYGKRVLTMNDGKLT